MVDHCRQLKEIQRARSVGIKVVKKEQACMKELLVRFQPEDHWNSGQRWLTLSFHVGRLVADESKFTFLMMHATHGDLAGREPAHSKGWHLERPGTQLIWSEPENDPLECLYVCPDLVC